MSSETPATHHKTATDPRRASLDALAEATLRVHGLGCRHCVDRITRALERVDGARHATMDYDTRLATITYDPTEVDPRAFIHAVILEGADRGQSFDADLLKLRSLDSEDLYPS